jgi:adenosine deaminase
MAINFVSLPKFDLHFHLEGAIPRGVLFELWINDGQKISRSEFDGFFAYKSFSDFIALWCKHQGLLFSKASASEVLPKIVQAIGSELHSQNTLYVEGHISPIDACFMRFGFPGLLKEGAAFQELLLSWDQAVSHWHESEPEKTRISLILDLVRNYPREVLDFQVEQLERVAGRLQNLIGVGLGGGNDGKSLQSFRDVFLRLKKQGLVLFAHAGEHGPEKTAIQEVLDATDLGVKRIGHGIHALRDPEVLEVLKTRDIPLEICPTSNLVTGTISHLSQLPLGSLLRQGVPFCLGSDDPSYFGSGLAEEYEKIQTVFELEDEVILNIWENSLRYSLASEEWVRKATTP